MIDKTPGGLFIIFVHGQRETHVRRVFEHLAQGHVSARVRIDHPRPADHHPPVARVVMLLEARARIVEQRHQRRQFKRGTRFEVHANGIIEILDKLTLPLARQVRDRTYLAGGNLHQHGRTPVGITQLQLFAQRVFGHVLHVDIERRHHVDPVHRRHAQRVGHRNLETARNALHQHIAVGPAQHAVERSLDAPFSSRLVDAADRARGHRPVGQQPFVDLHGNKPAPVLAEPQDRESGYLFDFKVIYTTRSDLRETVLALVAVSAVEQDQVSVLAFVAEKGSQRPGQRIGIFAEHRIGEPLCREIHPHFVHRHGGGQQPSVPREDISAVGLYGHPFAGDPLALAAQAFAAGSVLDI